MRKNLHLCRAALVAAMLASVAGAQTPLGTAFTYQGRLTDGGAPANGVYDLRFQLWANAAADISASDFLCVDQVNVADGLFTVELDFGDAAFVPDARWLTIAVRPDSDQPCNSGYTALSPARRLNSTPQSRIEGGGNRSTVGGGHGNIATESFATVGGGFQNEATGEESTIAGGRTNKAGGVSATIGGGVDNVSNGLAPTVGGGAANEATGDWSTVAGGRANAATAEESTVGGGYKNIANGEKSVVAGGEGNTTFDFHTTVGGGRNNVAGTDDADDSSAGFAFVGGGESNSAGGQYTVAAGGWLNAASGDMSAIGGGHKNIADGNYSVVAGGDANSTIDMHTAVGGGQNNVAGSDDANDTTAAFAFVGGGESNYSGAQHTVVAGGLSNSASAQKAVIGGGQGNSASGQGAIIVGGVLNQSTGDGSVVVGGGDNLNAGVAAIIGAGTSNKIEATGQYAVVGGGTENKIVETVSLPLKSGDKGDAPPEAGAVGTIGGGSHNELSGGGATIGGGASNRATDYFGTVGGGFGNVSGGLPAKGILDEGFNTIGGGQNNQTMALAGTIAGGSDNYIQSGGDYASILGGGSNLIGSAMTKDGESEDEKGVPSNTNQEHSTIGGGYSNEVYKAGSVIGGGIENSIADLYGTIGGGLFNAIGTTVVKGGLAGSTATIGGGQSNFATGIGPTIGGGGYNQVSTDYSVVAGGLNNYITDDPIFKGTTSLTFYSAIGGGRGNSINASYAVIGGGHLNFVAQEGCTIGGGLSNVAGDILVKGLDSDYYYATVGGGYDNRAQERASVVSGGESNDASAKWGAIPGGYDCTVTGDYSLAAGRQAAANAAGSFVWADSTAAAFSRNTANEFAARATGGVRFFTNAALSTGVQVNAGAGAWAAISDVNQKEAVEPVDSREVLDKVAAMPVATWEYKSEEGDVKHMGPMAQDFREAFGLGHNDTSIVSVDADGVALAAIKGLNEKLEEEVARKDAEISDLKRQMEELRAMVESMGGAK